MKDIAPTSVTFTGRGVRLAGDRWDPRGTPRGMLLLLHGGGQTRHSWDRGAERFARAGWTTYTLDARGHGDSDWAPDGDYSEDALVGDLRAVIREVGSAPVLVGASMGGITALVAEGEHPGLGSALVLVDVVPRLEPGGVDHIRRFMSAHPDGFESLDDVADAVAAYNPNRPRPTSTEGLKKNVRLGDDGRWHWHWDPAFLDFGNEATRRMRLERMEAAARRVSIPTLLVRGSQSDVVGDEGVRELRALIPQLRVSEANAGHMVAGDDNDVFTRAVVGFLDDTLGGAPTA